jgi:Probable Zinc-ribbon domain
MCEGNKRHLCKDNTCKACYENSFASHPKSIYWSKNNQKQPRDLFKKGDHKALFDCPGCGHEITKRLADVTVGESWCMYCCPTRRRLCQDQACDFCYNNSFASHPKSQHWSSKNDKTPRDVSISGSYQALFDCPDCGHEYRAKLGNVSNNSGGCPYCYHRKMCPDQGCQFCYNASFASHPKSVCWSSNNDKTPREVFKSSTYKALFICGECRHEFPMTTNDVSNRCWCPYYAHQKLCSDGACNFCYQNSFASHPNSTYWHDTNTCSPRAVFKSAQSIHWFYVRRDICLTPV